MEKLNPSEVSMDNPNIPDEEVRYCPKCGQYLFGVNCRTVSIPDGPDDYYQELYCNECANKIEAMDPEEREEELGNDGEEIENLPEEDWRVDR
jgi:hypothetical protein